MKFLLVLKSTWLFWDISDSSDLERTEPRLTSTERTKNPAKGEIDNLSSRVKKSRKKRIDDSKSIK